MCLFRYFFLTRSPKYHDGQKILSTEVHLTLSVFETGLWRWRQDEHSLKLLLSLKRKNKHISFLSCQNNLHLKNGIPNPAVTLSLTFNTFLFGVITFKCKNFSNKWQNVREVTSLYFISISVFHFLDKVLTDCMKLFSGLAYGKNKGVPLS